MYLNLIEKHVFSPTHFNNNSLLPTVDPDRGMCPSLERKFYPPSTFLYIQNGPRQQETGYILHSSLYNGQTVVLQPNPNIRVAGI